jgi:two-component system, NtrC family, response regulator
MQQYSPDLQTLANRVGLLTQDQSICGLVRRATRFAQSDISILITGESGTGKEVLARALHGLSPRASGPFGVVNVAALPESLIESSLFGAERGSFTGASTSKTGLVESAAGGTFFFDEIGDFPIQLQAKLLRLIQERKVMRVGATQERTVDVRFIFATHRNLTDLVAKNLFREDLFYRVSEIQLEIPALRDRGGDSIYLAKHFAEKVGRDVLGKALLISPSCLEFIRAYEWPGNVRELYSAMKRAVILCDGSCIEIGDLQIIRSRDPVKKDSLPLAAPNSDKVPEGRAISTAIVDQASNDDPINLAPAAEASDLDSSVAAAGGWDADTLNRVRIEAEVRVVLACLKEHGGNVSSVAKILNISRPTVYSILRKAKEWVTA